MSSPMTSRPNATLGIRSVSTLKYELFAALAVILLRGAIFVIVQKAAGIFEYHSDGTLSLMTGRVDALIATLALGFINLPCYALASLLASRRVRTIRAGIRTGLKAGLFSGLVTYMVPAIVMGVLLGMLILVASALPHGQSGFERDSRALLWWWIREFFLNNLFIIAFDIACGALMGWLGGVLGKRLSMLTF